ncbi:MAG TPA: anti-sigma factor [Streptosporangiaceae bacterium]|nr:anti-sigma factor [Streptosporangiaceae bacterium]
MSHTDPMILALRALGETAGTSQDDEHAQTCPHCRHEQSRLAEVVDLARHPGPAELLEPPPAVWDRIAAAVGTGAAPSVAVTSLETAASSNGHHGAAADSAAETPAAAAPAKKAPAKKAAAKKAAAGARQRTRVGGRRRHLATVLAGLAAGLIIGIGGTAGVIQLTKAPTTRVVAQIELSPLPAFPQWQGATGTAVMRATAGQQVMVVTLHAPQRPGFYEVWLLARNGVSMISLGDLNADHTGTFTVPPGVDLRNYSRIDVSLQPFNGSTLHSKSSVVRGSLPAVAFGAGDGSASAS